jgi:hypothetical protein
VESKSLIYSSFSSSSPSFISLSFYFSLFLSLRLFSLSRTQQRKTFFRFSLSRLFSPARERAFFLFFSVAEFWAGPITGPTPTLVSYAIILTAIQPAYSRSARESRTKSGLFRPVTAGTGHNTFLPQPLPRDLTRPVGGCNIRTRTQSRLGLSGHSEVRRK